eukprot:762667-Hanusia_phi.AAC.8
MNLKEASHLNELVSVFTPVLANLTDAWTSRRRQKQLQNSSTDKRLLRRRSELYVSTSKAESPGDPITDLVGAGGAQDRIVQT